MTASVAYGSELFNSSGVPLRLFETAWQSEASAVETVPTTSLDEAGDCFFFLAVPEGKEISKLEWDVGDHDTHATETLDMDIILRVTDKDGNNTDTILFNAGTGFEDAAQDWKHLAKGAARVSGSAAGYGLVGFKVNTAAATPAAVASSIGVHWR